MKLTNTVVTITVTVPEIEVDKEQGIAVARRKIAQAALLNVFQFKQTTKITDCPDYPALIEV